MKILQDEILNVEDGFEDFDQKITKLFMQNAQNTNSVIEEVYELKRSVANLGTKIDKLEQKICDDSSRQSSMLVWLL